MTELFQKALEPTYVLAHLIDLDGHNSYLPDYPNDSHLGHCRLFLTLNVNASVYMYVTSYYSAAVGIGIGCE